MGLMMALTVLAIGLVACTSTVAPKPIKGAVASWDGGQQNSGLIGKDGPGYFLITEHARERYNGLIERYGRYYLPPLKADEGVTTTATNGVYRIDGEHLAKMIEMVAWKKEGR
jgi:hypothetical protein